MRNTRRPTATRTASEMVQLVNLRVTALGRLPGLQLVQRGDPGRVRGCACGTCGSPAPGFVATPVHWRTGLSPGDAFDGPLVIEALDSTTVVPPGWRATVDRLGLHPDPSQ